MPKKRQPKEVWRETRVRVLERDGFCCVRCGVPVTVETSNIDHIRPITHPLGNNRMENLRSLCRRCHVLRADPKHRGMIAKALEEGLIGPNWRTEVWD